MLDHLWLTGLQSVFQSRLLSPPTHRPLHMVRHKKATKRTRQSAKGDAYVVHGYGADGWNSGRLGLSMPFVPPRRPDLLVG